MKMISLWRGKRLEDLTREELIEAVEYLGRQVSQFYDSAAIRARALGDVEMMKRGERPS